MSTQNIEDIYPLSPMQQGMLYHSLYQSESREYVEQMNCKLYGDINAAIFEKAWQHLVDHHSILRTAFVWEDLDEPLQVVSQQSKVPFEFQDWREYSSEEQAQKLTEYCDRDRERGFNFSVAPLLRIGLFHSAENIFHFVWTHHHLLLDGWSLPILLKNVFMAYEAYNRNLSPLKTQIRPYRDYIAWLQQQDIARAEQFWRKTLKDFHSTTPFRIDGMLHEQSDMKLDYRRERYRISEQSHKKLQAFARQYQLTVNTLVQGAWALLLSQYSGNSDVLFGATVSGRPPDLMGSEMMVGIFINTLPIRVEIPAHETLINWLKNLQFQQSEIRQFEFSSLVQVQGWSEVPRDMPLFESILVFENYPVDESVNNEKSSFEIRDVNSHSRTNYPLTVAFSPGKELGIEIAYNTQRFSGFVIKRIMQHLEKLLEDFIDFPEQSLAGFSALTEQEQKQTVVEWNETTAPYPENMCLHHLFEEQVEKNPDAPAVIFKDKQLSYRRLNHRANELALHLQQQGVGPESLVALCLDPSIDMIVAIMGTLKAGGAYVPIDPAYPKDRVAYILKDTQARVLLTQENYVETLADNNVQIICLDADWDEHIANQNPRNVDSTVTSKNLAYVIYTSGSTGRPKGVMLRHDGVCNFLTGYQKRLQINSDCRFLQFLSYCFDGSVGEIFPALTSGAALCIVNKENKLPGPELFNLLREYKITSTTLTPSLLAVLPEDELPTIKHIGTGGESTTKELVRKWTKGRNYYNLYGPTEASVVATAFLTNENVENYSTVPIGKPFENLTLYILDARQNPVMIGVPGELHIGGIGLARGYLNNADKTAEKFIPNPFGTTPGERIYKTGDLCRYLPDGNIEFLGRIDFQVKVRGFRIELGEIEESLNQHPAVDNAAVLARDDKSGNKMLVAYWTTDENFEDDINVETLQGFLRERLPDYMVPSIFVQLTKMPLTRNGKIDRKALPAPDMSGSDAGKSYVAPRTPTEELLAGIWEQVLQLPKVGVHDNFFELGGHSLLGVKLQSRIKEAFQVDLPLKELFEIPTIAQSAKAIEANQLTGDQPEVPPIKPVSRDQVLPLSFSQMRLWFLDQLEPNGFFYNIPTALRLSGNLNADALEQSLNEIFNRHESLRTTFNDQDGKPYQEISADMVLPLEKIDLRSLPESEREADLKRRVVEEASQPFNLSSGPLFRVKLLYIDSEEYAVLLTMHHIISDGWSVAILIRELAALYAAFSQGKESPLPEISLQYPDFAHWQRGWLQGEVLDEQLSYWKEQLKGVPPLLELPTDRPRPVTQTFNGATVSRMLPKPLSDALKEISRNTGSTLFMTLLTAFQTLLYRYTGQPDICVGTPIANRNRLETENMIGFFVNTLVMRSQIYGDPTFHELLQQVRKVALGAYAHQDLPFETLVEELQPERDLSHSPLFQVMFVLQNIPMQSIELNEVTLSSLNSENKTAKFDLVLVVIEAPAGLRVSFEYNIDLFDTSTIERMTGHFQQLLEGIVADPEQKISRLPLMRAVEERRMLVEWNQTQMDFPKDRCMHEWFESLAAKSPDAVALTLGDWQLTYGELNHRANQLAYFLQKQNFERESLVGICMDRSLEMIVGILGTLKAGGAFIPLDPVYPPERLAYMINDSSISILLTQQALQERFADFNTQVICVDSNWWTMSLENENNLNLKIDPVNLAYIIYTSGSTGKPKGTMLQHLGWCNLAAAQQKAFGIGPGNRILQFSSLSFDASVWEFVMALLSGAALSLTHREILTTGQGLLEVLEKNAITTVTLPPSVLAVVPEAELPQLDTIITAGEACTPDLVARWSDGRRFFNAYGPTETTVCASMFQVPDDYAKNPPIGKPIGNFQLYILDDKFRPVPIGVPGELCIGSVGLARGYLNRPDLTAEKFIANPFSREPGARLYRSGDLARYLIDGNIEFLGRIDHQVKVRGFRIELGEIEAVLDEHAEIRDVVVIVREDIPGDKRIVAYLVTTPDSEIKVGELKSYVRERLPEYMVPSAFMSLDELPLTPNGKVNRRALPAPDQSRPELENEYVAPRNNVEEKLATIGAELLGVEKVGIYDNFFELGGHSLLATQFISRLRSTFDVEVPLRSLFEKPIIAELAQVIENSKQASDTPAIPTIKRVSRESRRVKRASLDQGNGKLK